MINIDIQKVYNLYEDKERRDDIREQVEENVEVLVANIEKIRDANNNILHRVKI